MLPGGHINYARVGENLAIQRQSNLCRKLIIKLVVSPAEEVVSNLIDGKTFPPLALLGSGANTMSLFLLVPLREDEMIVCLVSRFHFHLTTALHPSVSFGLIVILKADFCRCWSAITRCLNFMVVSWYGW